MALAKVGDVNPITSLIIKAAIEVHRWLGPGLLESTYLACLLVELRALGLPVDLVVDGSVIVEVKCVEHLAPVHSAQLLTYLKLTGCRAGLLLNFNVPVLKNGIRRLLNTRDPQQPADPRHSSV